jgi:hypothetical protein
VRALHGAEHDLVVPVGIGQQLVVVELDDEGEAVRVLARHRAERADRRGDGVAAALDREADEVVGVEVHRVGREARRARVLDPLVDRQDADVARTRQATAVTQPLEVAQHVRRAVGVEHDAVDEVRPGEVQLVRRDRLAAVREQVLGVVAEQLLQARGGDACGRHGCHPVLSSLLLRAGYPRGPARWRPFSPC